MKYETGSFTREEIERNHEIMLRRVALFREYGMDQEELRRRIVDSVDLDNRTVLEIGTGKGYLTVQLALQFNSVVTIDTDDARQRISGLNAAYHGVLDGIEFITADASRLGYPGRAFDAVVSAFTFHHLEDPEAVVGEMARVAAKQVVIAEFSRKGFDILERIHASEGGSHDSNGGNTGAVRAMLEGAGFNVTLVEEELQLIYTARRS